MKHSSWLLLLPRAHLLAGASHHFVYHTLSCDHAWRLEGYRGSSPSAALSQAEDKGYPGCVPPDYRGSRMGT